MQVIGPFRGGYYFMSGYFSSPIHYKLPTNNLEADFPTVQHALEAAKFPTANAARQMLSLARADPRQAHQLGKIWRQSDEYNDILPAMLEDLLLLKFPADSSDPNFRLTIRLLETGDVPIVYMNYWHDNKLGMCVCTKCSYGRFGVNLMGFLLMHVRKLRGNQ